MSHMHAEHKHVLQTIFNFFKRTEWQLWEHQLKEKKEKKKHNHILFLVQKRDTKESSPDSLCF